MKIFMLMRYLDYSGASKMFIWVAETMHRLGHEVVMCAYGNIQKDFKQSDGIELIDLTKERNRFPQIIFKLRKLIKTYNPDVSISFLLDANVYNILACKGLNTKSVVCERNDPYKPGYYKLKFFKPLFRMADGAVFQLPKAREYYDNIKVPTAVIPNPILSKSDLKCEPYSKRKHIVVTHGRLDIFQKRQDVLIDAFGLIIKEFSDFQLHIYGSQNQGTKDEELLKKQIQTLGLEGKVLLMGVSKNPQEDIKDAFVWVSTSDFEGISNAQIDAMSIGLPCVATDCSPGGASFLISNKKNGLLVERGNIKAVYQGIKYMIEHPKEADEMGHRALDLKKRLDGTLIGKQWESYLLSL